MVAEEDFQAVVSGAAVGVRSSQSQEVGCSFFPLCTILSIVVPAFVLH